MSLVDEIYRERELKKFPLNMIHRVNKNGTVQNIIRQEKAVKMAPIEQDITDLFKVKHVEEEVDIFAEMGQASKTTTQRLIQFTQTTPEIAIPESVKRLTNRIEEMEQPPGETEKRPRLRVDEEGNIVAATNDEDDYEFPENSEDEETEHVSKKQRITKQAQKLGRQVREVELKLNLNKDSK